MQSLDDVSKLCLITMEMIGSVVSNLCSNLCQYPVSGLTTALMFRITMCSSIFLVMGTSVERFLAVCRPHHYRNVSTV